MFQLLIGEKTRHIIKIALYNMKVIQILATYF